jgi:hypothetical protein
MDQRELVKTLKKQYFWGVNVLVVLVALACWWMATAAINKRYATRKGEIDKHVKAMKELAGKSNPPNKRVVDAIQTEKIGWIQGKVADAWDTLYQVQQQNNKYPESLGKEFKAAFEERDSKGELKPLSDSLRENYSGHVKDYWKKEFAAIGVPFPDREKPSADPNRSSAPAEAQGIVDWDANDAARFLDRFQWTGTPSTAQVRQAQEDLWVYAALLRVVKNTNGDATNRYAAAVKRIEAFDIGAEFFTPSRRSAAPGPGRRDGPRGLQVEGPMGRAGGMPPGAGRAPTPSPTPTPPSADAAAPAAESDVPDNRYVNDKFEGLKAGDKAPYVEFKMMPVRMRLVIDQRKLAKLLVECANSSMPIEVRKLTILSRGEATPKPGGKAGAPAASSASQSHEMAVDVEGRIYIFNAPQVKAETAADAGKKPDAAAGDTAAKETAGKTEAAKPETEPKPEPAENKTEAVKTDAAKTDAAKTEAEGKPEAAAKPE